LLVRHLCLSDISILWASKAAPERRSIFYFSISLELGELLKQIKSAITLFPIKDVFDQV
jgi:hypothetical protein